MFEVTHDQRLGMLRVTLRGFWNGATMAGYTQAVQRCMADLRRTGGCKYVLINMIDFPIQSTQIADAHAANLRNVKRIAGVRVALVMQSALSRLQASRVAADTGHRTFATEDAALDWLLTSEA